MHSHNNISHTEPLIVLSNVSKAFASKKVLDNVSLTVNKGDFVAITGPNGGGKTTLLRLILRLIKPSSGSITYHDRDIKFGYLPQKNMIDSRFPITVREVVTSGLELKAWKRITSEQRDRVEETIAKVGLQDLSDKAIGELSGGQLQRALLGRAIIGHPSVLVLDEPLSYIDKQFEKQLYEIIELLSQDCTVLVVSHEMTVFSQLANRHLIVNRTVRECQAHHHYHPSECE